VLLVTLAGIARPAVADDFRSKLLEAQEQFQEDRYHRALDLYQEAARVEPDHAAVEYNIGLCHLRLDDPDKAVKEFERVAARRDIRQSLRRDALYNIGLVRARAARGRFDALSAPATQPAEAVAPDDPANIETLQEIAADLLRAIRSFREADEVEPTPDAGHNIRAARILRRNVLGLLRRAMEQKEKEDILDDPRAYLEALIAEQARVVGLTRTMILTPPESLSDQRDARRGAVRLQRTIMERCGVLADNLGQFKEAAPDPAARANPPTPPSTQPAEETPRERIYHAAAEQVENAVEAERDACAHLLDAEIQPAHDRQFAALEQLHKALYLFPQNPAQALVRARADQVMLKGLVESITSPEQWLVDPSIPEARIPPDAEWDSERTAMFIRQLHVGNMLVLLRMQCEHIAESAAEQDDAPSPSPEQQNPMLDPELNRKLADALVGIDELRMTVAQAVADRNREATLAAQEQILAIIDAAIELLPKTIEQRIAELIVEQSRLNDETKAQAPDADADEATASPLQEVRQWAVQLKNKLFGEAPERIAGGLLAEQTTTREGTQAVAQEVRAQVPAGVSTQPSGGGASPGGQQEQVQAYIEAGRHLARADERMVDAIGGFQEAVVDKSLSPLRKDGPVRPTQEEALQALVEALAALRPPEPQDQQDEQNQQQQQNQPQPKPDDQDLQRQLEQMEKERERARQGLYERRPREVIKDW
jgi:tetratricopeptide (TPR) repeat protein